MKRVDLMIIDPENDFCASGMEPDHWPQPAGGKRSGALFVTGADVEAVNLKDMMIRLADPNHYGGHKITNVRVSIDSHHPNDGSHNTAWQRSDGSSPPPFTIVTTEMVEKQELVPRFPVGYFNGKPCSSLEWAIQYTKALAVSGRAPLCLWPPHCMIGTWGQCVYQPVQEALDFWTKTTGRWVDYITKGQFPFTEHYSALRADVPDPTRPETQLNVSTIQAAMEADIIGWLGWAGSHCLRYTALDAANYFGNGENEFIRKSVFFEDASAAVPNPPGGPDFALWRREFLDEMDKRGATITTTTKFLA